MLFLENVPFTKANFNKTTENLLFKKKTIQHANCHRCPLEGGVQLQLFHARHKITVKEGGGVSTNVKEEIHYRKKKKVILKMSLL